MTSGRLILGVLVAAVAACAVAYVAMPRVAVVRRAAQEAPRATPSEVVAAPVAAAGDEVRETVGMASTPVDADAGGDVHASRAPRSPRSLIMRVSHGSRDAVVLLLPPSLLEFVRTTRWDDDASLVLEEFVSRTFDMNGDGAIDDLERIYAVRALRDAVWEDVTPDDEGVENPIEPGSEENAEAAAATLSADDRRLHHEVDQERRRDHADFGGEAPLDDERRSAIVVRFEIDDDGRVTTAELARYLEARRANLPAADLNGDGAVDDADLRVYLDVTSPIVAD
ncbi:MAG: hypothetical protein JNM94_05735 [Phycisphaerae bacterium]|nr:hypothetical protein [Phycisphaerae bacterium]